jgi:signal peptidase
VRGFARSLSKIRKKLLAACVVYLPLGFLALLILANFYLGINKALTRNPVPTVGGFAPLIVLSGSMEPAIHPGDLVVIRGQRAEQYKIGDIATYLEGQTVYTHRIVSREGGLFILQGDNNNTVDEPVRPEQFAGKVLLTIPKIGLLMLFFQKPAGLAVLALLVFLYVFGEDLYAGVKKVQRRGGGKRGKRGDDA